MSEILPIALLGDPVLRKRSDELTFPLDKGIQQLIDSLLATMIELDAVGMAAPQAKQPFRIFVMLSRKGKLYPNAPEISPMEVVNPEILSQSDEKCRGWESCYSMPGYHALITRPVEIRARWKDRHGNSIEHEFHDLAARVFLHEYDHLEGKMFLERMDSISDLCAKEDIKEFCSRAEK